MTVNENAPAEARGAGNELGRLDEDYTPADDGIDDGSTPPVEVYEDLVHVEGNGRPASHLEPVPADDPDEILVAGQQQPLVPDDQYRARFLEHARRQPYGIPKIAIKLEVVEGEHTGTILTAWRNVQAVGGRSRVQSVGENSKLAVELRRVAKQRSIEMRPSRLTVSVLRDTDLQIQTATTGSERPYSVVSNILGLWPTARTPSASPHSGCDTEPVGRGDGDADADSDARGDLQRQRTTDNVQRETNNGQRPSHLPEDRDEWLADYGRAGCPRCAGEGCRWCKGAPG